MELELISTKRCPLVQRSIITLNHKGIDHQVESDAEEQSIRSQLLLLRTRLAPEGGEVNLLIEQSVYRQKMIRRFPGNAGQEDLVWKQRIALS